MIKIIYKLVKGSPIENHQNLWRKSVKSKPLFLLVCLLSTFSSMTMAQDADVYKLTGKITAAEDGGAIPGATVLVKGTNRGTNSDVEGNYALEVAPDDIVVVSFIGYITQEVNVGGRTKIDFSLSVHLQELEEVVVIGYGEMRRADMSSAQTSISSEDIEKTVNATLEQAIQGRAAGVYVTQDTGQPGGSISIAVGGINSINGSNEPLYVIDGVQIEVGRVSGGAQSSSNPLAGLNPSDIESLEILRGPSATAIYGSRATNGVVIITTKRGKAGDLKVDYGYLYSLQGRPEELPVLNLREFAEMTTDIQNITGGTVPAEFLDISLLGEGTNWQEALFDARPLQKHQLSLSGGSEKTTFYLSGEYFTQEGIAVGSDFERYSVRLNVDNQTRDWLKINGNFNFSQTDESLNTTQGNLIQSALQMAPNIPVTNPDGTWGGADADNGQSVQFTPLNPIALANLETTTQVRRQFLGGINAEVQLIDGLVASTNFNTNLGFTNRTQFRPTFVLGDRRNDQASLDEFSGVSTYWNWSQIIRYNKTFGKHTIGVMVGHEAQESNWKNLSGGRVDFVSNDILDLNIGDANGATNGGGSDDWAMDSYFSRINYSYDDKYILQAAIRRDGSVNFGPENRWGTFPSVSFAWRMGEESFMDDVGFINELKLRLETGLTGNQGPAKGFFGPLAGVTTPWGTGFRLGTFSNPELQWEETLTYNAGINISLFENRVQIEGDVYLKKTDNLLLNNPLPDYMGTAGEGAISPPLVNIGALENKGFAVTLSTVNYNKGGFTWRTNLNFSSFRTEITEFFSETAVVDRVAWFFSNFTQRSVVGQAPWMFFGYVHDGIFQSIEEINNSALPVDGSGAELPVGENGVYVGDVKYKDLNEDGIIDDRDQTFIGNPWPEFFYGITNTFSYKGFDLSILLTGSYGNDIFNYLRFINTDPNNINLGRNMLEETFGYARVGDQGGDPVLLNPGADVPRLTTADPNGNFDRITDKFIEDGSYLRIKNVTLTYNLPASLLSNQNIVRNAQVSVGVQNLYTFTNYSGLDPEVGAYVGANVEAGNQQIGVDPGRYPLTRVYTLGVNIGF